MAALSTVNSHSPAQAMWRTHLFMRPGQKFDKASCGTWNGVLNYKREIDAQQQTTTEAQNPINNKGDKQKSFTIDIEINKLASGLDPLTTHKFLMQSLGKKSLFFIGAIPIDSSYYYLKSIELRFSNMEIAATGEVYRAFLVLEFVEDVIMRVEKKKNGAEAPKSSNTGKPTASKVGASKASKEAQIKEWQKNLFG